MLELKNQKITDKKNSQIELKIEEIANCIINNYKSNDIGLLTGNAGTAIFLCHYAKFKDNENFYDFAISLIEKSVNKINDGNNYHTFCGGIGGFLWGLLHLYKNDFLDKDDISDLLNGLDDFLYKKMITDAKNGNYDFLHGAVGIGIYFLERLEDNPNIKQYLIELINELDNQSHKDKDGSIKWLSVVDIETGKQAYNLSLSHGIASIIAFLSKAYKQDINKEKVKILLDGSLKFLLNQKCDAQKNGSYFPSYVDDTFIKDRSRMAWCYGDLGISVVLYNTAKVLNDTSLEEFSLKVLLDSTKRIDLQQEYVLDAGLCHGSAGMAHIFNRMFLNTGIEKFKETADFWFNETIKMAKFDDGLAGFKAYHTEKYGGWANEYGILEGVSGIGLALLSWQTQTELAWDNCLLLS